MPFPGRKMGSGISFRITRLMPNRKRRSVRRHLNLKDSIDRVDDIRWSLWYRAYTHIYISPTCPLMVKVRDCHLVGKIMVLARGVDVIPSRLFILEYHLSIGGRIHLTCSMGKKPGSNGSRPSCCSVRNMGICTHEVQ